MHLSFTKLNLTQLFKWKIKIALFYSQENCITTEKPLLA